MRLFITGGTGFVGGYLLEELQKRGHKTILLVRPGSEEKLPVGYEGEIIKGDAFNFSFPSNCDAVIHLIGILRENLFRGVSFEKTQFLAVKQVANAALTAGVKRFVLMSANGVKPDGTPYQSTKFRAEEFIIGNQFEWTIFRPSVIFGDPNYPVEDMGKPEFCTTLLQQIIAPRIPAPLFFPRLNVKQAGMFRLQPIHVRDVVKGITMSITDRSTIGKIYHTGGKESFTWKEIITVISKVIEKRKWKIPVPAWGVKSVASLFGWLPFFPITSQQITMLMEGNVCDAAEFLDAFGIDPKQFCSENLAYLKKN